MSKKEKITRCQRAKRKRLKQCPECKEWGFRTNKKIKGVLYSAKCRHCGHIVHVRELPAELQEEVAA